MKHVIFEHDFFFRLCILYLKKNFKNIKKKTKKNLQNKIILTNEYMCKNDLKLC